MSVLMMTGNKQAPSRPMVLLNPALLEAQQVPKHKQNRLMCLHEHRIDLVFDMATLNEQDVNGILSLRQLAARITKIDFLLQRLWGFTQDIRYHRWFELPSCSCPKFAKYGEPYTNPEFDDSCVLHGIHTDQLIKFFYEEINNCVI